MRTTIQSIFTKTNLKKQVLMFTATLNKKIKLVTKKFMKEDAAEIIIDEEKNLSLHGLTQFYVELEEKMKNKNLFNLLHKLNYNQVIIFTSKVQRAKYLNKLLNKMEFQSITIHRDLDQHKRYNKKN